ncbi:hypothetical protein CesoFtcFv8_003300 [Champsocephalus esox]|uniref:Uncharacterized protein n=1 Tax=Champsocephalus esox TaxID=159716 RepID=A0AAN8CSI5_9TELE|nr:hypothetical protein CesoFtcFv8_003300 [Champsocephalus esox]
MPAHNARVHTQTIAIIQPDNRGHFHEKGEFEESEQRPEHLLHHVAPLQTGRGCDIMSLMKGYPGNCMWSFVYSAEGFLLSPSALFFDARNHKLVLGGI